MAGNQELFQALQMFQQGVQQAATTSAVNDATQAMQDIHTNIADQAQQRQALDQLSRQTALRLVGTGADGTQIQSAFQAVAPQQYGSVDQLQIDAALTGNKQQAGVAQGLIADKRQQAMKMMQMEYGFKQAMEDKKFNRDLLLEQMKLSKTNKDLKPEEVAFQTNINVADKMLNDLEQTFKEKGTFEIALPFNMGSEASRKASAKLDALPYQLAITYAKIVDPNSVAREGEVAAAQKYLLDLGLSANEGKALEALTNMRDTIKSYAQARGMAQGKAPTPTSANPNVQVRTLKDGSRVKVIQLPDGTFQKVD